MVETGESERGRRDCSRGPVGFRRREAERGPGTIPLLTPTRRGRVCPGVQPMSHLYGCSPTRLRPSHRRYGTGVRRELPPVYGHLGPRRGSAYTLGVPLGVESIGPVATRSRPTSRGRPLSSLPRNPYRGSSRVSGGVREERREVVPLGGSTPSVTVRDESEGAVEVWSPCGWDTVTSGGEKDDPTPRWVALPISGMGLHV